MFGMVSQWTEEREALLRELCTKGSNAWIARQLNERTGSTFTRNAIISKRWRSGMPPMPKDTRPKPERKPRRQKGTRYSVARYGERLAPDFSIFRDCPEAAFLNIPLLELTANQCRYARGGEGDEPYFFCGQPTTTDSSYCPFHHGIVWVKPTRKRKPERQEAA